MEQFIFSSGQLELKSEGENFYVEGYISTSDLDLVNDIVTKGCMMDMADQMQERTIKLDIEHEAFRGKNEKEAEMNKTIIPVAKIEDFLIDKKGLKIKAMLNRHIPRFNEIKNSIKDGFIDAFSIAFVPVKETIENKDGIQIRKLEKINLLNVAFTGNPINTNASIEKVFMKSLDSLKAKPKTPPKRKIPESEYEDEDEEDKEKKKSNSTPKGEETIKLQEVKYMEENKETIEEKVEESKEEVVEEAEAKDEEEKVEAEETEIGAEVKSLIEKVELQAKEIAELKSSIKMPVRKSMPESKDKSADFEDKSLNPLDFI